MNKVAKVMAAERRNYDALVAGKRGRYTRVDEATKHPVPDLRARPEAG